MLISIWCLAVSDSQTQSWRTKICADMTAGDDVASCTHLGPRMSFDLRKLEFLVVGIHFTNLVSRRSAQNFDDLNQLVDSAVTGKYRITQQQFRKHTAGRPHIWTTRSQTIYKDRQT